MNRVLSLVQELGAQHRYSSKRRRIVGGLEKWGEECVHCSRMVGQPFGCGMMQKYAVWSDLPTKNPRDWLPYGNTMDKQKATKVDIKANPFR